MLKIPATSARKPGLKYRYLDLRREPEQYAIRLRSKVSRAAREALYARDFVEIETPTLTRSTPEVPATSSSPPVCPRAPGTHSLSRPSFSSSC